MAGTEIQKIDIAGDGSVVKVITKHGKGNETPQRGDSCSVHYVGRIAGAKKPFDSSGSLIETIHHPLLQISRGLGAWEGTAQ